jgi:hypothetical protein
MARTIIARNAGADAAYAAVAAVEVGTIVRYTYTLDGQEFAVTGRVLGTLCESLAVKVLTHGEFPHLVGSGMRWNGRFTTVVRRPRRG